MTKSRGFQHNRKRIEYSKPRSIFYAFNSGSPEQREAYFKAQHKQPQRHQHHWIHNSWNESVCSCGKAIYDEYVYKFIQSKYSVNTPFSHLRFLPFTQSMITDAILTYINTNHIVILLSDET